MAKEKIELSLENKYIFGDNTNMTTEFTEKEMFALLENSAFYLQTKINKSLGFIHFKRNKKMLLSSSLENFSLLKEVSLAMTTLCQGKRGLNLEYHRLELNRIEIKIERLTEILK